ncbi:MAG: beta-galactosidase [Candidatus Sungbacteria bacterium]|nr:beta-galactosidase [Candidatus Sungbacteria bacterium]
MTWLITTLIASVIIGTASIFDKMLLKRRGFSDPWVYAFWVGILGFAALLLAPFGVVVLPLGVMALAFGAGAVFLLATFFFLWALRDGEASEALPIIGGLAPIATYLFGLWILHDHLGIAELIGFFLLVVSGVIFLGVEHKEVRLEIAGLAAISAVLFGLSNILKKMTFTRGDFLSAFVWISVGGALLALASLALPHVRKKIHSTISTSKASNKEWYLANRAWAAIGTILVSFAIAIGHPALVEAAQGFKYVVIFVGGWLLLKEEFFGRVLFWKIVATILIVCGLGWLGIAAYAESIPIDPYRDITWGITFSDEYSRDKLGLDWRANFNAIVDELRPKKMRVVAYWDEIEQSRGVFDFSNLDWELARARESGIGVVLALGMRVPRWPECHMPAWAAALDQGTKERVLGEFISRVVMRYRDNPALQMWQVENEPFLRFGLCATRPRQALQDEIALVKSLDPLRPVVVTDGGEFGLWTQAIRAGDIFGTTIYRRTYPPSVGKYTGIIDYPLSPSFFRFKQKLARLFTGEYAKPFVVIELQAEPWGRLEVPLISYQEQTDIFSLAYFRETIEYAKQTGFDEYYLWGAEWWYYVREKEGDTQYWDIVKNLLDKKMGRE